MKNWLRHNWIMFAALALLLFPMVGLAHPGRTASDGCHYCRTNCSSWGVSQGARHCHGGYTAPATPTPIVVPTKIIPASTAISEVIPAVVTPPKVDYSNLDNATTPVFGVIDGDTIKVKFKDGSVENVRLIGIDTPETVHPSKPIECFGEEASKELKSLLVGKTVVLKKDSIGDTIDKYGRLLRYVYLSGTDINAEMVKNGFAYAYTKYPFDRMDEYKRHETKAQEGEVGLWESGVCDIQNIGGASTSFDSIVETKDDVGFFRKFWDGIMSLFR